MVRANVCGPVRGPVTAALIRPLRDDDVPAVGRLVRALVPSMVVTDDEVRHMRHSTALWVAEVDGEIVGSARAGRVGRAWVGVDHEVRRHGIGTALLEQAEQHLRGAGHPRASGWIDCEHGERFCSARGYQPGRRKPVSVLHLDRVRTEPPAPPSSVQLVPLRDVLDRPDELYAVAMAAYADEPSDAGLVEMRLEEWLRDDLHVPDLTADGSIVALVAGRIASYSLLTVDGRGRAENEFTGTHPDFRGRGLARLCKLAVIDWAHHHRIREIWTGNDEENAPMLAINRRLGYRVVHIRVQYARAL